MADERWLLPWQLVPSEGCRNGFWSSFCLWRVWSVARPSSTADGLQDQFNAFLCTRGRSRSSQGEQRLPQSKQRPAFSMRKCRPFRVHAWRDAWDVRVTALYSSFDVGLFAFYSGSGSADLFGCGVCGVWLLAMSFCTACLSLKGSPQAISAKNHTARPKLVALPAAHLLPPSASNCWGPQKWRFIGCVIKWDSFWREGDQTWCKRMVVLRDFPL